MRVDKNAYTTNCFLENFLTCNKFCHEDYYYFVWNQIKSYSLRKQIVKDSYSNKMIEMMYKAVYDMAYKKLKHKLKKIPI